MQELARESAKSPGNMGAIPDLMPQCDIVMPRYD
jgi:hypothetical protein